MTIALVIGNGTSRRGFDLNELPFLPTYLCGIAHREINEPMYNRKHVTVEEYRRDMLLDDGIAEEDIFYPEPGSVDHVEDPRFHGRMHDIPRNNSGMFAMKTAILNGATNLYILGFDSFIKDDLEQSVSNMFEGKPETRARAEDNPNRIRYLDWFCNHNMLVQFNFVFDKEYDFYEVEANNIRIISYERFKREVIQSA